MGLTGQKVYIKLKKVSNDLDELPLDENNIPTWISGEPQEFKDNVIGDPDYVAPITDLISCPIAPSTCKSYGIYNTGVTTLNFTYRICGGATSTGTVAPGLNTVVCAEYDDSIVIDSGDGYFIEGSPCSPL